MLNWWEFILIILATWRIVSFIQGESGPFDVMLKIRSKFGVQHDEDGVACGWPDNLIGGLLRCFWCLSVWVALVVWIISIFVSWFPILFALSAGAILLNEIIKRLKNG
jgi:hypothetical protein